MSDEQHAQLIKMLEFAREHRLAFVPVQFIVDKARTIQEQGHCICVPDRTECPCKECLTEVYTEGKCHCKVFCTYEYGYNYLKKYFYIDDSGNPVDDIKTRKRLIKEYKKKKSIQSKS